MRRHSHNPLDATIADSLTVDFPYLNKNKTIDTLSPVQVGIFLKDVYPDISSWVIWDISYKSYNSHLRGIVNSSKKSGKSENFSWEYIDNQKKYINNIFKGHCSKEKDNRNDFWFGFVRITIISDKIKNHIKGSSFYLFSYLNSQPSIGVWYCSSTNDYDLLEAFGNEVELLTEVKDKIKINSCTSYCLQPIYLKKDIEMMVMNEDVKNDIEKQALMFFKTKDLYDKMGITYKRGFLILGSPGNGKTLMIRNLFRKIDKEHNGNVSFFIASVGAGLDTDVFDEIFKKANDEAPSVLVFEDIESLTKDSMITRSEFLNKLDGINVEGNGVLVIGTTNNPADVDNALIQRPSRFDRVWYFKLPDEKLRLEYLKMNFKGIEECNLIRVAKETSDWNFSYLNELRTSSALLSISDHQNEVISNETFLKAFELLKKQFELCKNKENILDEGEGKKKLGFAGL